MIRILIILASLAFAPTTAAPAVEYRGWGCSVEVAWGTLSDTERATYSAALDACTEQHWPGWYSG